MASPLSIRASLEVSLEEHVSEVLCKEGEQNITSDGIRQKLLSCEKLFDEKVDVWQFFWTWKKNDSVTRTFVNQRKHLENT